MAFGGNGIKTPAVPSREPDGSLEPHASGDDLQARVSGRGVLGQLGAFAERHEGMAEDRSLPPNKVRAARPMRCGGLGQQLVGDLDERGGVGLVLFQSGPRWVEHVAA